MQSPWGQVDHKKQITEGVLLVETPSHGGYRVAGPYLEKLTEAQKKHASAKWKTSYEGMVYWYEEDCEWRILAHKCPDLELCELDDKHRSCLTCYNADYLCDEGEVPDVAEFNYWFEFQKLLRSPTHDFAFKAKVGDRVQRIQINRAAKTTNVIEGTVLSVSDPTAWANTLAFGENPDPLAVARHVIKHMDDMNDNQPVLWDGTIKVVWTHDLKLAQVVQEE